MQVGYLSVDTACIIGRGKHLALNSKSGTPAFRFGNHQDSRLFCAAIWMCLRHAVWWANHPIVLVGLTSSIGGPPIFQTRYANIVGFQ